MVTLVARKPVRKINFDHLLKRWCSIKEIEVYLLCEILTSKDILQGQKNCCEPPLGVSIQFFFFWSIPNFLNRLLDSLLLVRSTWKVQHSFVLDWTLAWFTFSENRYFLDNDKQKSWKTVKLKFCATQISLWKANTTILNCGAWQTKYTRTKKFCMFVLK